MIKRRFAVAVAVGLLALPGAASPTRGQETGAFASKENLDLPYEAIGDSEDEEEAPEIVIFYGQQYEGDGFVFCCDKSGSMQGDKWRRLQQEVVKDIQGFSEKVEFAIILFDASIAKFPSSGKPAQASPAMKGAAMAMVMSTQTGHGTCCKPALIQALNYANQSTARRKVVLYLSDGRQTCNGQDEGQYGAATLAEVSARNTQRVHINTLCIGPAGGDVDENWMQKLAAGNNGKYSRIIQ